MGMLPLAAVSIWWTLFAFLWGLLALALILIVLIQKGRGGGLGAAFGGGGANSLLGTKTGDFLTWVTICLVSLFLIGAVVMAKFMRPHDTGLVPAVPEQAQTVPGGAEVTPTPEAEQAAQGAEQVAEQSAPQAQQVTEQAEQTAGQAAEAVEATGNAPAGQQK